MLGATARPGEACGGPLPRGRASGLGSHLLGGARLLQLGWRVSETPPRRDAAPRLPAWETLTSMLSEILSDT